MNSYRLEQLHVNITMDEYIEVASDPELEVIILSSYMQVWMLEKKKAVLTNSHGSYNFNL